MVEAPSGSSDVGFQNEFVFVAFIVLAIIIVVVLILKNDKKQEEKIVCPHCGAKWWRSERNRNFIEFFCYKCQKYWS